MLVSPFFRLSVGARIPYAVAWDRESGEFRGLEGPHGFATVEASRFLAVKAALTAVLLPR